MSISPPRRPWNRLFPALLEALLPEDCSLCGLPSRAGPVCAACAGELDRHGAGACPCCGDVSPHGETCGHCLGEAPAFDATHAAFVYAYPVDRLVQGLKYGGQLHLARWFAGQLAPRLAGIGADLVVPMPLHAARLRTRGFNQALEIARPLARALGLPLAIDACRRCRDTAPQAGMERQARLRNLRQAFECRLDLGGRHVLVVDDVMTTGTSVGELARVLKLHGAARVSAALAARTLSR